MKFPFAAGYGYYLPLRHREEGGVATRTLPGGPEKGNSLNRYTFMAKVEMFVAEKLQR